MKPNYLLLFAVVFTLSISAAQSQVLNRLKSKGDQKAGEAIDKLFSGKDKKKTDQGTGQTGTNGTNENGSSGNGNSSGGSNNPSNKGGGGLNSTPSIACCKAYLASP